MGMRKFRSMVGIGLYASGIGLIQKKTNSTSISHSSKRITRKMPSTTLFEKQFPNGIHLTSKKNVSDHR